MDIRKVAQDDRDGYVWSNDCQWDGIGGLSFILYYYMIDLLFIVYLYFLFI
jgi:hypothetical protein